MYMIVFICSEISKLLSEVKHSRTSWRTLNRWRTSKQKIISIRIRIWMTIRIRMRKRIRIRI